MEPQLTAVTGVNGTELNLTGGAEVKVFTRAHPPTGLRPSSCPNLSVLAWALHN